MKFIPKNPSSFRNVLNVMKGVHSEIYAMPKENSIVFWTIDPPSTMIYSAILPKSSMLVYEVERDELETITAYDIRYIEKALRKVKADTQFTFNQTGEGYTEIIVEKPFKTRVRIPQFSTDAESIDLPEIPMSVWLEGYGALLNDLIDTIKAFTTELEFIADAEKLKVVGETETSDVVAEITPEHDWVQSYEVDEDAELPVRATYDVKRLATITKGIGKSTMVTLAFGTDVPLYVRWEDSEGFKHNFLLAPRVREE